jgi:hypothetical protein
MRKGLVFCLSIFLLISYIIPLGAMADTNFPKVENKNFTTAKNDRLVINLKVNKITKNGKQWKSLPNKKT